VGSPRYLIVIADDYGIGPETSRGILDLARRGAVTGAVLLVTSPHAEADVAAWRRAGSLPELGWHPCLTLDAPLLPARVVPSLVGPDGRFWSLGQFLRRLLCGRIRPEEIDAELRAQLYRYQDLVGAPPGLVNAHHHIQVFPPVGAILRAILSAQRPLPYFRRLSEPWQLLASIPGARAKRALLSLLGRRAARRLVRAGFPGADWHVGITDPHCVTDPEFFARWLRRTPGRVVELCCHPGYLDRTLVGRDCEADDEQLPRRPREWDLLHRPGFLEACRRAGFVLAAPADLNDPRRGGTARVA
jgi:predicted glycoside hydrolase/deacetylase ChbG (UPF0249 family)